ncbi:MAG: Flp pilus assembly protein CpaB [Oscillospiraceae bacterium]
MLKNRTLIGIVLIVAAIGLCFGISPLFNTILASKTTIIRLKQDIPQGVQITGSMLEAVEVGTMNLPADMQNDPKKIIGKYSVTAMFAGDSFNDKKLSDTIDTSDSLLRQLKPNETAMSVTVKSLANGLSGKLQQGDIIQIVSVDEDDKAQIYEELQYVEVLATTSDKGSDNTYNDGEVNANAEDGRISHSMQPLPLFCRTERRLYGSQNAKTHLSTPYLYAAAMMNTSRNA